jgi:predicted  nucleic acid-binding Zn-ribbon protein
MSQVLIHSSTGEGLTDVDILKMPDEELADKLPNFNADARLKLREIAQLYIEQRKLESEREVEIHEQLLNLRQEREEIRKKIKKLKKRRETILELEDEVSTKIDEKWKEINK